ncbi:exonuclease V a 5' deoxyribonuclease-domain-containing protein [Rhexocercosporidium sp. MPI-PUGE-AT-0058]|nr:exonuclease V a 5' deoxyribonuclease-domain-containing protein [Rhexocercosporidium sp. MPI-PUGE-AT-0058]
MASPATTITGPPNDIDSDTDYGSDFSPEQEQIVERLIAGKHIEEDNPIINEIEHHDPRQTLRLPRIFGREEGSPLFQAARAAERVAEQITESVKGGEHPDLSDRIYNAPEKEASVEPPKEDSENPDLRSPIERFRTPPKKALSVTDLVSPAWCELQYWYTLTKHGRKRRTPAMKEGTRVHKVLEEQVYTTVRVEVQSREDAWGLRIWNVIQGLRTLRVTGQTRELEIWGTVDGLVVNGVIDELSYICPDTDLEHSLPEPQDNLPSDQTTIADFFKAAGAKSLEEATKSKRRTVTKKVYLCDVKTRAVRSVPSASAFKPTKIQLMLYHRLLSSLATNAVDFSILASRYNLDITKVLSDEFIAQVGSLNDEVFYDALTDPDSQAPSPNWSQDSMSTLLAHNTLNLLWSLMITEFQLTLPNGVDSLGRVLKAEYRSRDDGEIVGVKTLAMDDLELTSFISHEMEWWKGERQAEGVVVEEAFKCRSCDFADGCEWRLQKVEDAKEKARMSRRRTSAV